jgi:hypothetical protein
VPKEFWHTERFRSVNRRISAAWGVAIASTGVGHLVASLLRGAEPGTTVPSRPLDLVFNWVLPIALIWWAVRYTNRLSKRPDDTARPGPGHPAERPSGRTA